MQVSSERPRQRFRSGRVAVGSSAEFSAVTPRPASDAGLVISRVGAFGAIRALLGLPSEALAEVETLGRSRTVDAGAVLCVQGMRPERCFLIRRGSVHVEIDGIEVAKLCEGDLACGLDALTGRSSTVTVLADTPVEVLQIDAAALRSRLAVSPTLVMSLLRALSSQLRAVTRSIAASSSA